MSTATEPEVPAARPPRLAVQAFWLMVARTVAFFLTLALPLILVRLFDEQQFGVYRQLFVLIATSQNLLLFAVGLSAFYFLPRMPEFRREVIFNIVVYHLGMSTLAAAVLTVWPEALTLMLGNDALVPFAFLVGAVIGTNLFASFFETVATANQDVVYSTAFIISVQLTRGLMIVVSVYWFRSVEAVLYALLIQNLIQSAALLVYLHYRFPFFWRYRNRNVAREQFHYVLPFGLTFLISTLHRDLHNYVVSNSFAPAQFALYAVATSPVPLIAILRDSVNGVLQARMSKLQHEGNSIDMLYLMLNSWRTLALFFLPAFAGLMVLSSDFIQVLYGSRYMDSLPIFRLNLFVLPINIFITDSVIRAFAEHKYWMLRLRIPMFLLQVCLLLAGVRYLGMIGGLLALLIVVAVELAITVVFVFRLLHFRREHLSSLWQMSRIGLSAAGAAAVLAIAVAMVPDIHPALRLFGGVALYGFCYGLIVIASGLLTDDERSLVNRWTMRLAGVQLPGLGAK